jgi:hypothetical protein
MERFRELVERYGGEVRIAAYFRTKEQMQACQCECRELEAKGKHWSDHDA